MNEHFFIYNKKFFHSDIPVIKPENHSFRYGDGLFETMRMLQGEIVNMNFHFERLIAGMRQLQFDIPEYFSVEFFLDTVNELLLKNFIFQNARIRLMVFRGDEGIFEVENNATNFIIETFPLPEKIELNAEGLMVDVFPDAAKSCDRFSNLKSNNYLPSVMAARFAKKNSLDDAIILNTFGRVCESAIANIFIIKDQQIITPMLTEGCVAGTMRRWMLEKFSLRNWKIEEKSISVEALLSADELFLTNSIQPIRWVKQFRDKTYGNEMVKEVFQHFIESL
ncbi:MAG TPA: aminotransferase class IV [Hanamia sp.]|nr:aminotransferase class IV [Hanamia sp.]